MKNRIFKEGLITTIVGLIIILAAVFTWMLTEKNATEAAVIAGIGSGLLFVKDKEIGIKKD
jgi:hypothetical protein